MLRTLPISLILGFGLALAAPNALPPIKAFDIPVSVNVPSGTTLEAALQLVARAANVSVVVAKTPETQTQVKLLVTKQSFRSVWTGLFATSRNLSYEVLDSGLIVVAPSQQIQAFSASQKTAPSLVSPNKPPADLVEKTFSLSDGSEILATLQKRYSDMQLAYLNERKLLYAVGSKEQIAALSKTLEMFNAVLQTTAPQPKPDPKPEPPEPQPSVAVAKPDIENTYTIVGDSDTMLTVLKQIYPTITLFYLPSTKLLYVRATEETQQAVATTLEQINKPKVEAAEKTGVQPEPKAEPKPDVERTYAIVGDSQTVVAVLKAIYPNINFFYLDSLNLLYTKAPQDTQDALAATLNQINKPKAEPIAPTKEPTELDAPLYFSVVKGGAEMAEVFRGELPEARVRYLSDSKILVITPPKGKSNAVRGIMAGMLQAANASELASPVDPAKVDQIVPLNYSKAQTMKGLIGELTQGVPVVIVSDERTNSLILSGKSDDVTRVAQLISRMDSQVPQVRLKVRIEQVDDSAGDSLGLNWKAQIGGLSLGFNNTGGGLGYELNAASVASLSATLQALKDQGKSRTLLENHFLTSNNAPVTLQSGGQVLVQSQLTTANGNQTTSSSIQSYDFGLQLKLTPQLMPNGTVQIQVDVNLGDTPRSGPNSTLIIPKQQLVSTTVFRSGNEVILGGLLSTSDTDTLQKTPILSDIPLIGNLFTNHTSGKRTSQLLVMISATVITDGTAPTAQATPAPVAPNIPAQDAPSKTNPQTSSPAPLVPSANLSPAGNTSLSSPTPTGPTKTVTPPASGGTESNQPIGGDK